MKIHKYIDAVSNKVIDAELRSRIRQELSDHWEDYCENNSVEDSPERALGNEELITHQTNTVTSPFMLIKDILLSVILGAFSLVLCILLASIFSLQLFGRTSMVDLIFIVITTTLGALFWSFIAWWVYLAFQRHVISRYGQSLQRVLLFIAVVLPFLLLVVELLVNTIEYYDMNEVVTRLVVAVYLLGLFYHAGRLISRGFASVDSLLARIRKSAPIIVAVAVVVGVTTLVGATYGSPVSREIQFLVGTPITLPLLTLYLLWGLGTFVFGILAEAVGLSIITGYWLMVVIPMFVGVVVPLGYLVSRKSLPLVLQFTASIAVPLVLILPMIPQDNPEITLKSEKIWDWDTLERNQLNIAYPWAASLMRQDDGANVDYAAYLIDGNIAVAQGKISRVITRENTAVVDVPAEIRKEIETVGGAYGEIPTGFTCDEKPLEELFDTNTSGVGRPLGVFGVACENLAYNGSEIATIRNGHLIDLDVSSDGLVALSINMGTYDPNYVYVVEMPK